MHGFDFSIIGAILFVAALVAMITNRLHVPYSVGLVAAGIVLALLAPDINLPLTRDLIYYVFLPPLVFEAAIQMLWARFRRDMPLLLVLVISGVLVAAAVVAAGMHWLVGWSWIGAALFGMLIAATDPVAVISTFKSLVVKPRLHFLVEADSLMNDGVAAVGFAVLAAVAAGAPVGPIDIGKDLVVNVFGGIAAGGGLAWLMLRIAGRASERLVEITFTMLIAYGSFLLAEHFHASGVIATLTAGLVVGNHGFCGAISDDGREGVLNFWEYVAFLINSLIFILIGTHETHLPILALLKDAAIAVGLSLVGRALGVYPALAAFARSKLSVPMRYQHILFWGGLRGALALALALALPEQVAERGAIVTVAFAVVAFSIFVQGLSMPWLVRRMGLREEDDPIEDDPLEEDQGTSTVSTASSSFSG